jgi:catalase
MSSLTSPLCLHLSHSHSSLSSLWCVQNDLNAKLMAEVVMRRDTPGHAFRAFHPKTLGCLHGEFQVNKNLAKDLRVGLFQPGATYKTIAHFATSTPIHPPGKY